jgi:hypothetical protein
MIQQQQLGDARQLHRPVEFLGLQIPANDSVLGNKLSQAPAAQAVAESLVDLYRKLFSAPQPALRLALLKQEKFTPEGKEQRMATSLAALNAAL